MPSFEPDKIPYLEPLSDPDIDDAATSPPGLSPPPPLLHSSRESICSPPPVQIETNRNVGQFVRDATKPIKLKLVLENKGNVARDHLASERTYLAYVRTSLACASAGVALVQLLMLNTGSASAPHAFNLARFAKPVGATVVLFSLIILAMGVFRYFTIQSALVRGYFPIARHSITAISFAFGALVITVFAILLAKTR